MTMIEQLQALGAERFAWAAMAVLMWLLVCLWARHRHRKAAAPGDAGVLIAYASQTGTAESLARATLAQVKELTGENQPVRLLPLNSIKAADLQRSKRLLLVVSTGGQGDPPENARQFVQRFIHKSRDLRHLEYALLGLGDKRYKHFCGFAEVVEGWLLAQGASPICASLKADRSDPRTLATWEQNIALITCK